MRSSRLCGEQTCSSHGGRCSCCWPLAGGACGPMSSLMPEHPRLKQVCELGQTPNLPTHSWHNKTQTSKYIMCMFMPCCSIGFLRLLGHHAKVCGGALLDGALRPFQPEGNQGVWRCVWSLVNLYVCEGDPCPSPPGCPSPFVLLPPCCYKALCPQVGQQDAEGRQGPPEV